MDAPAHLAAWPYAELTRPKGDMTLPARPVMTWTDGHVTRLYFADPARAASVQARADRWVMDEVNAADD